MKNIKVSTSDSCNESNVLLKKEMYYKDALNFSLLLENSCDELVGFLLSKTKTDVVETIYFFSKAFQYHLKYAETGVKKLLYLIWSKDLGDNESKSIKEVVINAYFELFFDFDNLELVFENLVSLTKNADSSYLISLEQLFFLLINKSLISDKLIEYLWKKVSSGQEICNTRSLIMILGMFAKGNDKFVSGRVNLLMNIGLCDLAQVTLICLSRMT